MRKYANIVLLIAVLVVGAACSKGPTDESIANDIKARMFSIAELKESNIDVKVAEGVVTLMGEAASESARYHAYKLAGETAGVKSINDQMTLRVADVPPPAEPPAPRRSSSRPAASTQPPPLPAPLPASTPAAQPAASLPPPPVPVTRRVTLAAGTPLSIRMIDSIDSEKDRVGQVFRASLDEPIQVSGETVVPAGNDIYVKLVTAQSAGRMAGRSELQLELARLEYQGATYVLDSSTYEQKGASEGKRTAATIGGGAAIGAAIGAIAGGGRGAAIGAATGAGAGTAVSVITKGQQVRIPSETRLEFRLESPVDITYDPSRMSSPR